MFWMLRQKPKNYLNLLLKQQPSAKAVIKGSSSYPNICGIVYFYQTKDGVLLITEVSGLPHNDNPCDTGVFGFHIHEGSACIGKANDPFADVGMHYNPKNCKHPHHAGDLPPLFENHGYTFMVFLTDRITVDEIIGRTVIIHGSPDDFTTQPSGNSGQKIACGQIK
ncbi:MAG: superoxide dismutase family protein [Clostridia bacterium]|nr:superoxide dismutase family protein [Clostridia bacterium]